MQEIRILFTPPDSGDYRVALTNVRGESIGMGEHRSPRPFRVLSVLESSHTLQRAVRCGWRGDPYRRRGSGRRWHCVFADNEVAFRLRGPGKRGGAHVTIAQCAIYDSQVGVRAEDKIEQFKIMGLAFGAGVKVRFERRNGKHLPGFEKTGEREALVMESLLKSGFSPH